MAKPYLRVALEQAPNHETGTNPISTNLLWLPSQSFDPKLNPELEDTSDEMRGLDNPPPEIVSEYNPDWKLKERAYPNLVPFLLLLWAGKVTTTAGDGIITDPDGTAIPVGAHRHVFAWKTSDPLIPYTCQFDSADDDTSGPWWQMKGAAIEKLKVSGKKGFLITDASGKALYGKRETSDPGLTPAEPSSSLLPWSAGQIQLSSWLSGSGTNDEFSLEFDQSIETFPGFGISSKFPTAVELNKGIGRTLTGNISKRDLDVDDWDALMNGTTFAAMAKYISAQYITGSYPYKMWIDMPECQYTGGDESQIENTARRPFKLNFAAKHDTVAGYAVLVTVVNGIAAYNTFA